MESGTVLAVSRGDTHERVGKDNHPDIRLLAGVARDGVVERSPLTRRP
ncbi:hypothetical protein ACFVJM_09585 [Streptomyces virginiae]